MLSTKLCLLSGVGVRLAKNMKVSNSCSNFAFAATVTSRLHPNFDMDVKSFSTDPPPKADVPIVGYDEVKDLPNHPEKMLVDVRERNELLEYGRIPTSINVPLGEIDEAFSDKMDSTMFLRAYGADKPTSKEQAIICSCQRGVRSLKAARALMSLGYTNVKNYEGSYVDWAEREGMCKK